MLILPYPRAKVSQRNCESWERAADGRVGAQYPGEKEITFPPFTCLESDGDPRLERDAKGNEVVIFPLKVPAAPPPHPPTPTPPPPTPHTALQCLGLFGISAARAEGRFATQGMAV